MFSYDILEGMTAANLFCVELTHACLIPNQVLIVGYPMVLVLSTVDANGRFLGLSLITFTIPASTMGLLFLPKMVQVHRMEKAATAAGTDPSEPPGDDGASMSQQAGDPVPGLNPTTSTSPALQQPQQENNGPRLHTPKVQMVVFG